MPFTVSHAVVAIPFVRTPIAAAAVAVGAMAPDLPLFVRAAPYGYAFTHAVLWSPVTACFALVLLIAWRVLVRPATVELSPPWIAARLPQEWDAGPRSSFVESFARVGSTRPSATGTVATLVALWIGVMTHLLWDAFTHEGRWGSVLVPALAYPWGPLPGYAWLQYGSSAFGLIVLLVWGTAWIRGRAPHATIQRLPGAVRWLCGAVLLLVFILAGVALGTVLADSGAVIDRTSAAYGVVVPAAGVTGIVACILFVALDVARTVVRQRQRGVSRPHGRGAGNDVGPPA